jgi:predicted site-specific integrase-resolvase
MKDSNYRVLEFSKEELEKLVKDVFSNELHKMFDKMYNKQSTSNKTELMTREEVSALLNVSLVTLHNWDKKKYLVSRKIGGRVLYLRDDVYSRLN